MALRPLIVVVSIVGKALSLEASKCRRTLYANAQLIQFVELDGSWTGLSDENLHRFIAKFPIEPETPRMANKSGDDVPDRDTSMKVIIARLRRLEAIRPVIEARGPSPADLIRERRRLRFEKEGRSYVGPSREPHLDACGRPLTSIADTSRVSPSKTLIVSALPMPNNMLPITANRFAV